MKTLILSTLIALSAVSASARGILISGGGTPTLTDSNVNLDTAAITSGKFGDDRVAISTAGVISGKFGDNRLGFSTAALSNGNWLTAQLPSTVAYSNAANAFTAQQTFGTGATISTITSGGLFQLTPGSTLATNGTLSISTAPTDVLAVIPNIFIDQSGNVGIGRNSATQALHVNGSMVVSSSYRTNNGINNDSSVNNARMLVGANGASIDRNITGAAGVALTVNQIHASATGDILDLQAAGVNKIYFPYAGGQVWGSTTTVTVTTMSSTGNLTMASGSALTLSAAGQGLINLSTNALAAGQKWLSTQLPSTATYTNIDNNISATQTFGSSITWVGSTDGSNAGIGQFGEFISTVPTGVKNLGVSNTFDSIATTTLTAGDWDVSGFIELDAGATFAGNVFQVGISLTPNNVDASSGRTILSFSGIATDSYLIPTPTRRIVVTGAAVGVYLTSAVTYTVNGGTTYAVASTLRARRMR